MQKLIVIVGPTSSGKTKLAVDLARKFDGEIVSADSRQVYCGMDIGTGKELKAYSSQSSVHSSPWTVRHHLIDVVSPKTNFTLAQYQKLAYRAINDILRRGKVPILVGGTGLYVQTVVDGYVLPEAPPDLKLRARLAKISLHALCAKLKKLDPATYRIIDKNNRRRLERAIEIIVGTGVSLSKQRKKIRPPYDVLMLGLGPRYIYPRSRINVASSYLNVELYRRIDGRLRERLRQGMVQEVRRLHKQGISWKRLESFGLEYRYVSQYLKAIDAIKRAKSYDRTTLRADTRQQYEKMVRELAKAIKDFSRRQMTWFKRDKRIVWVRTRPNFRFAKTSAGQVKKEAERLVRQFLKV